MFINFWYPVALSAEIAAKTPYRTQILGLQFVAFRDGEGRPHVLSDTCVHRGGSLGKGTLKDGSVVCPYHGWRFAGDGRCTAVPSLGDGAKVPARAKVDSYPVEERYGIVFAFLGDQSEEERSPLCPVEEYGKDGWRANEIMVFEVDYYYERSMENGVDPAHNEFVHPTHGFSGERKDYRVKDYEVEHTPFGVWFNLEMESSGYKDEVMSKVRTHDSVTTAMSGTYGPNTIITYVHMTETTWFHQYLFEAPIDESRTRIFFLNMRNFMLEPKLDKPILERNKLIAHQDIAILTELNPVRTPPSNAKEILTPSDKVVVAYRERLKDWEDKGWRIDMKALRRRAGDAAFAIPSPARRQAGNWVVDPVPLVAPDEKSTKLAAE